MTPLQSKRSVNRGVSAADFLPPGRTLAALAKAAQTCEGCDLYKRATQTVFGAGAARARLLMVGEQPGDREDREGAPFVGPAGLLLNRALDEAGIPRETVYVTNAVKHFKWKPVGKRRIHEKPRAGEVRACRPWLMAEIETVGPEGVVCLGATAAQALIGSSFRVTVSRGRILPFDHAAWIMATVHPASVLRSPEREEEYGWLLNDLRQAAQALETGP